MTRGGDAVRGLFGVVASAGAATLLAIAVSGGRATVRAADTPDPVKLQYYKTSVQPVLQANCYRCHSGMNRRGGLQMDTRQALLHGGHDGPAIVAGRPEDSLLIKLIRHEGPKDDPMSMPPKGKLSDADIAVVTRWVQDGAVMDR